MSVHGIYHFSPELRAYLESSKMPLGIFQVFDGQYKPILVTSGACELFELGHEELHQYLGNKSYLKMHPDDAGKLMEASKGFTVNDENLCVCRMLHDGVYHPILFYERPHILPDGTTLYAVFYFDLDRIGRDGGQWFGDYVGREKAKTFLDEVTGLPNLHYFQTFAPGTLKEYLGNGQIPKVVLFDIRGMHFYNDSFGYDRGDGLLKKTGEIIRNVFAQNFCVRYMEDHFVVITAREDITDCVNQVRTLLQDYAGGANVDINAGIYAYSDPHVSGDAAVDMARRAADYIQDKPDVYLQKYDGEVAESYQRKNYILSSYRDAIRNGWIKVYYQPLVNSLSGQVAHCEALSRWDDPEYGFMNPGEFIGILEESHKLWELDLYVLEVVCRALKKRSDEGKLYPHLSVNISRHDFMVPDLHERINTILDSCGVGHDEIAIEITESALAEHEEEILRHIQRFHRDGYQVWLDDFGSGYSSFSALQNFDFDLLKVDMQFLLHQNSRTPDILKNIIDLTKKLGIKSVTEGVETKQQRDFLRQIGCGMLQGYYYSKPIPGDIFFEELEKSGLQIESAEDRRFYEKLQEINFLNIDHPLSDGSFKPFGGEKSLSIVIEEEGRIRVIYTDQAGYKWMEKIDSPTLESVSRVAEHNDMPIHKAMRTCFGRLQRPGEVVSCDVSDPSFRGEMEVALINQSGQRRGFLVSCMGSGRKAG